MNTTTFTVTELLALISIPGSVLHATKELCTAPDQQVKYNTLLATFAAAAIRGGADEHKKYEGMLAATKYYRNIGTIQLPELTDAQLLEAVPQRVLRGIAVREHLQEGAAAEQLAELEALCEVSALQAIKIRMLKLAVAEALPVASKA